MWIGRLFTLPQTTFAHGCERDIGAACGAARDHSQGTVGGVWRPRGKGFSAKGVDAGARSLNNSVPCFVVRCSLHRYGRQCFTSAPVAQLDRVPGYELGGREFESLRAHHYNWRCRMLALSSCFLGIALRGGGSPGAAGSTDLLAQVSRTHKGLGWLEDLRGIAQSGRALRLGRKSRGFESLYPDQRHVLLAVTAPVAQPDRASAF